MSESVADLRVAIQKYSVELPGKQVDRLHAYCQLLWQWNEKINLTRHTDYDKFVSRDLIDSLAFSQFLQPKEKILDVGTGGGVPGIVLAIIRPDLRIWLAESVGKKARVVTDIVAQLRLKTPVHPGRAEDLLRRERFNSLAIRAVAPLAKLLTWFKPHWSRFDRLLILKGPAWVEERGEARHLGLLGNLALRKLHTYPLAGTDSESVLLQICPEERLDEEKGCRLRLVQGGGKRR